MHVYVRESTAALQQPHILCRVILHELKVTINVGLDVYVWNRTKLNV